MSQNNFEGTSIEDEDYIIDFTTSSSISRVNIKFLAVYLPILWFSSFAVIIYWYDFLRTAPPLSEGLVAFIPILLLLPIAFLLSYYIFMLACVFFSKFLLVFINLIHEPKEGIFRAEIGNTDFEFWCLRTELKKFAVWVMNNTPLPWIDILAFRWFGVKIDFSSHLFDAWVDVENIHFGRKVMVGQGAVVMSSMVVGNYLIIKKVIFDDYTVIGGQASIAPGTIMGRDTVLGACTTTTFNQVLEPGWIYFGIPARKLKKNKFASQERDQIVKKFVDDEKKVTLEHETNIDEDKKHLV